MTVTNIFHQCGKDMQNQNIIKPLQRTAASGLLFLLVGVVLAEPFKKPSEVSHSPTPVEETNAIRISDVVGEISLPAPKVRRRSLPTNADDIGLFHIPLIGHLNAVRLTSH